MRGILLAAERAECRPSIRQQAQACFAMLKRTFWMDSTLAKTLTGLPQGRLKELWAWDPRNTHLVRRHLHISHR